MIKTMNPYNSSTTSKTAMILSRYRPIAPKPEIPAAGDGSSPPSSHSSSATPMSQKIRQPPYMRNFWPQLHARPTRSRKRGRAAISPGSLRRQRTRHSASFQCIHPAMPPPPTATAAVYKGLPFQAFTGLGLGLAHQLLPGISTTTVEAQPASGSRSLVTLPLLPCSPVTSVGSDAVPELDLSLNARPAVSEIPEEKDLLRLLQGPACNSAATVIAPKPLRPVGSCVTVGPIIDGPVSPENWMPLVRRKREDVEEELESDRLPAVITDANNKVRLVNSAYKEMVGQPECSWLDSLMLGTGGYIDHPKGSASSSTIWRRINGEVALRLFAGEEVPFSSDAFTSWAKIEWGCGTEKSSVKVFCKVNKLSCDFKDYVYAWRFHIHGTEAFQEIQD
ncbi:hypothetical protein SAY87_011962 [Trapa incisa]|uniref:DUF7950 domain-containing protein n=1 Tax=Trapa incisa TaxID=236973 RepID=A0AAN7GMQ2_9MYRT|nr:hypothetical protein SAY87_011962 [Trapa incisa]